MMEAIVTKCGRCDYKCVISRQTLAVRLLGRLQRVRAKRVPPEAVKVLNDAPREILADDELKTKLIELGIETHASKTIGR